MVLLNKRLHFTLYTHDMYNKAYGKQGWDNNDEFMGCLENHALVCPEGFNNIIIILEFLFRLRTEEWHGSITPSS